MSKKQNILTEKRNKNLSNFCFIDLWNFLFVPIEKLVTKKNEDSHPNTTNTHTHIKLIYFGAYVKN